jgi:branched-chain amino acid transport system substrate-binding protein
MRKVLLVLFLVLFAGVAGAAEPIKIGVYNSLTGANAYGGQLELEGTQLALDEYPEVLGRPISLIVVDNKTDTVEAANAVTRLIEQDKVSVIIGSYGSSVSMAGGEVAETAKIPVVGTSPTNPLVTQGKKYYFRVCFIDPLQGAGAATYAVKTLGVKKAAMLIDIANDYSVGLGNFFQQAFEKLGGTIVSQMNYQAGDQDFTAQLTELISKEPELVFAPAYFSEGAIILKQAKELGATFPFMGGDAMDNPQIVELGGDAVEGFIHTTFAYDPSMPNMNENAKTFTERWRAAHPDREPNANAALGYDAFLVVRDAIERAGSDDPEAIRDALEATKGFPGVTGVTTINETHDAVKDIGIVEIKGGKKVFTGTVMPE